MTIAVDTSPDLLATFGHVSAVRDVSHDVVEVLVVPSQPVTILPGQYLKVTFEGFPARAFCPTVCLHDPGCADALYFHIRRVPGGRVSAALGHEIVGGHPVRLAGPFGAAYLQPGLASRLVLVAEDTGFAPIWSIAAVALEEQPERRIDLIVAARGDDFYMQPALRWLAAYANVTIACLAASDQDPLSAAADLATYLPEIRADDVVHVAGSSATVGAVARHASAAGAVCHAEAFDTFEAVGWPEANGSPEAIGSFEASEPAPERPSSLIAAWRLRGSRRFARASRAGSAGRSGEPGIRTRRGLDLYLAGSLAACSCLVLSTLALLDPANTFSAPSAGNAAHFVAQAAPVTAALGSEPLQDPAELSPRGTGQFEWDQPATLASASEDAEGKRDGATAGGDSAKEMIVTGVWAPDVSACPTGINRKKLLPAIITADGASAGDTFCAFKNKRPTESGLDVVANCSNANRRWTAKVRLTVNGKRLLWSSERGTQAYYRCEPNLRMAQVR